MRLVTQPFSARGLPLSRVRASPFGRRLANRSGRIEFVILRTTSSPPIAPHPALRRRSYGWIQAGVGLPERDSHPSSQARLQPHDRERPARSLARPTLLSAYIRPRRTKAEQCKPGLRQFASLNPIKLHAGTSTFLARFRVIPHQGKTEPSAVCRDVMVVNNDPGVRSGSMRGFQLRRVFRWRHLSRSRFLVPNVNGRYALGDQAVPALMPNPFPIIEQIAH